MSCHASLLGFSKRWSSLSRVAHRVMHPHLVPFELSLEEARERYLNWQKSSWFAPTNLKGYRDLNILPVFLPYWVFSFQAKIMYNGSILQTERKRSERNWQEVGWRTLTIRDYDNQDKNMQVYASYEYRHDFAEAMKPGTWKQAPAKTLPYDFHDDVYVDSVPVCAPEMRKSLAWELILRNIHRTETKRATDKLIEEFKTNDIRDVSVMIKPLKRHAELVYIPVFAIQFSYGETFNVHGERCKQFFNGLISASRRGGVAGERPTSVPKVSLIGSLASTTFVAACSSLSLLMGMDPWMWTAFDYAFWSVGTGAMTAMLSQMHLQLKIPRYSTIPKKEEIEQKVYDLPLSEIGNVTLVEKERSHHEWDFWEESSRSTTSPQKRKEWAEQLWLAQHRRRRKLASRLKEIEKERERTKLDELRMKRRHDRWGSTAKQHPDSNAFTDQGYGRRNMDYLGYYKTLNLDPSRRYDINKKEIKEAFRKAVKMWHPDKHAMSANRANARKKFDQAAVAYEVLKDSKLKKDYDEGILPSKR